MQPVNHTLSHGTHSTLGVYEAASVSLVAKGGSCDGTRFEAKFTAFPDAGKPLGSVLFTSTFPDGLKSSSSPQSVPHVTGLASAFPLFTFVSTKNPAAPPTVEDNLTCTLQQNTDYPGHDIRYIPNITSVDQCCALCKAEPQCVVFSLMGVDQKTWDKRCYLKSTTAGGKKPFKPHTSGVLNRPVAPTPPPTPDASGGLGWLTWYGTFMGGKWGAGTKNNAPGGDQSSGPIAIFDATARHGDGAMLSTFDEHFTSFVSLSAQTFGAGVSASVVSPADPSKGAAGGKGLAKGYTTSFLFVPGSGGANSVVMNWGAALQRAHNTSRSLASTDLVTTKLGYW